MSNMDTSEEGFHSKFLTDFCNIKQIGAGGFGKVFRARHKVDGREYAVKRILLPSRKDEQEKYLREARVMAKLEHPHIVRYHQTWVESPPIDWNEDCGIGGLTVASSDAFSASMPTGRTGSEFSSNREDESSSAAIDVGSTGSHVSGPPSSSPNDEGVSSVEFVGSRSNENPSPSEHSRSFLYIQMELCREKTLKDWLMSHSADKRPPKAKILEKFRNVVDAVLYVHAHGIIHRDLKPSNIFFAPFVGDRRRAATMALSMATKIGYGLPKSKRRRFTKILRARAEGIILEDPKESSEDSDTSSEEEEDSFVFAGLGIKLGDFGLVTEPMNSSVGGVTDGQGADTAVEEGARSLTKEVGTKLYMSPEQIERKPYNASVDIYSLGLMLFELLQPMSTEMERQRLMTDLKMHLRFPDSFESRHPEEKRLLEKMLAHNPQDRPTASDVKLAVSKLWLHYRHRMMIDGIEEPELKYEVRTSWTFVSGENAYPMRRNPRGHVLLISNEEPHRTSKLASEIDRWHLKSILQQLHFIVEDHVNRNCNETKRVIQEFAAKPEHAIADACFVVAMCAGDSGSTCDKICSSDGGEIETAWIHETFSDNRSPLLAGKPKVFVYQFNVTSDPLENKMVEAAELRRFSDQRRLMQRDMFIIYSAIPGYASLLQTESDSYIRSLWLMLEEHAFEIDFEEIVNSKVDGKLKQQECEHREGSRVFQVTSNGFTKKLFLNPGLSEDDAGNIWSLNIDSEFENYERANH